MLTVFLIVLPALLMPDTDLGWGEAGGRRLPDGARRPDLAVAGFDLLDRAARFPVLFLVLAIGNAGRAIDGGPFDGRVGRGGRGSAADIVVLDPRSFQVSYAGPKELQWMLVAAVGVAQRGSLTSHPSKGNKGGGVGSWVEIGSGELCAAVVSNE